MNESEYLTREHRLIKAIKDWTGERLIGDDCAILPGGQLVTSDMLVEGTHFIIPGISFEDLGWKSAAVNLSDIAAMGGRPRFAIVNLALPDGVAESDIEHFYRGLIDCTRAYRCRVVGGDLTHAEHTIVSLTIIGDVHENGVMQRSGARCGDVILTTGDFGASAAGLHLSLQRSPGHARNGQNMSYCLKRHFRPLPRFCEAWALLRQTAGQGAMMDASDGLADALVQISRLSGTGMDIEESSIPIHEQTRQAAAAAAVEPLEWALYGGEDYELVATVRPDDWTALKGSPHNPFTPIGKVTDRRGQVMLKRTSGSTQPVSLEHTFQHWRV